MSHSLFPRKSSLVLTAALGAGLLALSGCDARVASPAASLAPQTPASEPVNVIAGESEAKKLLLLMDKDKSGKVSRQEYMDYMAAEFDLMDLNHDGELDVTELTGAHLVVSHGSHR